MLCSSAAAAFGRVTLPCTKAPASEQPHSAPSATRASDVPPHNCTAARLHTCRHALLPVCVLSARVSCSQRQSCLVTSNGAHPTAAAAAARERASGLPEQKGFAAGTARGWAACSRRGDLGTSLMSNQVAAFLSLKLLRERPPCCPAQQGGGSVQCQCAPSAAANLQATPAAQTVYRPAQWLLCRTPQPAARPSPSAGCCWWPWWPRCSLLRAPSG